MPPKKGKKKDGPNDGIAGSELSETPAFAVKKSTGLNKIGSRIPHDRMIDYSSQVLVGVHMHGEQIIQRVIEKMPRAPLDFTEYQVMGSGKSIYFSSQIGVATMQSLQYRFRTNPYITNEYFDETINSVVESLNIRETSFAACAKQENPAAARDCTFPTTSTEHSFNSPYTDKSFTLNRRQIDDRGKGIFMLKSFMLNVDFGLGEQTIYIPEGTNLLTHRHFLTWKGKIQSSFEELFEPLNIDPDIDFSFFLSDILNFFAMLDRYKVHSTVHSTHASTAPLKIFIVELSCQNYAGQMNTRQQVVAADMAAASMSAATKKSVLKALSDIVELDLVDTVQSEHTPSPKSTTKKHRSPPKSTAAAASSTEEPDTEKSTGSAKSSSLKRGGRRRTKRRRTKRLI